MKAYERLIAYAKVHTASSDDTDVTPTTARQFDLAWLLEKEMNAMGIHEVFVDEHAYVYGRIPATPGFETKPCVGFIAHLDTIPDFCGENVRPRIVENYDGGDIALGESGRVLSPRDFPHLKNMIGRTLVVTDGTTVLGADDKAGIAEILTMAEQVLTENIPHGAIALCFCPDEEVGHGAALLDLEHFGAAFAYTSDGDIEGGIEYENFNAAAARVSFRGFNVHPGSAKDTMINASLVAMEFNSMLPSGETPRDTEDHEGFFHLTDMHGDVEKAELEYIIRDHDAGAFAARKKTMRHIEKLLNAKYGAGTVTVAIREQYRNMLEIMEQHPDVIELAVAATKAAGIDPVITPVRGGTDGAQLTWRGLPCPNLGTGGFAFHGPFEHVTAEGMDKATEILVNIVKGAAEK